MTAVLSPECTLVKVGAGTYERQASDVWWAQASLHGGYVLALAMEAVNRELADSPLSLHHLTMHYLRPFAMGLVRIEVSVEKRGRRLANATLRLYTEGSLAAIAMASAADHRQDGAVDVELVSAPVVEPYEPAANDPSPSAVPIQGKVWMQPRISEGEGATPARVGGWVAPRTPEPIDHRWLAVLGDLWTPAVYRAWDIPRISSTVDLTYHARSGLPRVDLEPGSPVLVVLTNRQVRGGFVDEDVEMWSSGGLLLAQCRQMRLVQPAPA